MILHLNESSHQNGIIQVQILYYSMSDLCIFLEINNLLNCIYGVIDEAYDVLNDMKNKDTFKSPHGNGLCDARNILEAFKQIARHVALGQYCLAELKFGFY